MVNVKTPLCKVCQVTGVLCPLCQRKLERGEVSDLDVKVSVFLGRSARGIKELDDVALVRAVMVDNILVLLFERGGARRFWKYGREIIKEMEREFKAKIFVLDYHPDIKEFVENVFRPVPVATINVIWLPDGSRETRVILERRVKENRIDLARKIIQKVMNVDVKVEAL